MRTITLELLRHGPSHNQLLSPLTPYLALCENHGAVTVYVPFEHNQFLFRLSALDYKHSEEGRIFQLKDTAKVMGDLLAMIPGLTAESNKEIGTKEQLTHVRLILSASELALLPFELAVSPNGFPGAGQHLLLQPQMPICLTREIRRVPGEKVKWPKNHRILFAAAAPMGVGSIPLESHLLTLRRAIEPWVKYFGNEEERQKEIEKHFVFLPEASIEAIEKKCASEMFTHVHILAHGVERKENYDTRFFLAMHNAQDPNETDYISGQRLATALRAYHSTDDKGLSCPVVVTLASCNSSGVGSVAGAGASIAHALHESGIPIVVAGQFPLSFKGSVRLVECLYDGLLWGKDPRWLLYDLRRRLYSQFPDTHDWASLTAYVSLPPDFEDQICDIQIDQAHSSIDAALNFADAATERPVLKLMGEKTADKGSDSDKDIKDKKLEDAKEKIMSAKQKMLNLLERYPQKGSRIYGLLASTEKRHAEVLYPNADKAKPTLVLEHLRKALDYYWEAFEHNRANSWALVQYVSLSLIINKFKNKQSKTEKPDEQKEERPEKDLTGLWTMAYIISKNDLHDQEKNHVIWAHANLVELHLLILIMEKIPQVIDNIDTKGRALNHTYSLINVAGRDSFMVYSTWRQLKRYQSWFNEIADLEAVQKEVEAVLDAFPEELKEVEGY